jgi:hypothetical protein
VSNAGDGIWYLHSHGQHYVAVKRQHPHELGEEFQKSAFGWIKAAHSRNSLGFDPSGKTTAVLNRSEKQDGVDWILHGGKSRRRVQVGAGKLKGYWIGLGAVLRDNDDREYRQLILVKEKEKAAVFGHGDPQDVAP